MNGRDAARIRNTMNALKQSRGFAIPEATLAAIRAEFDAASTDTHSWFIGYQGDIAFAAMVQKGGAGAEAAVPVIDRFLTALNK